MNMKKTIKIFALALLSAVLFGCQDAKLPVVENLIYINSAANGKLGSVNMTEGGTQVTFTVRMAQKATEDVKVAIVADPTILDEYNKAYQTSLNHVAAENLEIPALAIIPAGSASSDPITINVADFDPMGAQYALAFRISSTGSIPVAEESSKYIVQLMKPLKQLVPKFTYTNAMHCNPTDEAWGLELMNYTLEWWVRMTGKYSDASGFNTNNQAIINSGGAECELYIRFGDLIYSSGGSYDNRFLQIKTMGSQFDTGNPTEDEADALVSAQWYHFAITYDGNIGKSILYKNGQMVAELSTGAGRPMIIDRFQMCSSGSQYFPNYAEMCQVRLWNTTRSAAQIQKNMRSEVAYNSPELIMYLPMSRNCVDNTNRNYLEDVTGNGHDCYIGSLSNAGGSNNNAVAWTEYAF